MNTLLPQQAMPPRSPAQQAPPSSTKKQPTKQRAVVPAEGRLPTRAADLNAKKRLELGAAGGDSGDDEEMVGGREPWACMLIRGARSLELVGAHSPASRHRS